MLKEPPDYRTIYLDLVGWGYQVVSGWSIEHLPLYSLVAFWEEMQLRKMKEFNLVNHTGAYLMQVKTSDEKHQTKQKDWLPYDLDKFKEPLVKPSTVRILNQLRDQKLIPQSMIADLIKREIIDK